MNLSVQKIFNFHDARYGVGVKSLILSAFLYASVIYSSWFAAVFLVAVFYFYFRPALNSNQFLYSFLILIAVSLISVSAVNSQWLIVIVVLFGLLFFLLLGIKNLIFSRRPLIYHFLHGFLVLAILIFFFNSDKFNWFFIKYILIFFALFALLKEFLDFSASDNLNSRKKNLVAASSAFLAVQLIWLIELLPFSYWVGALFILSTVLFLEDLTISHLSGAISRKLVLRDATAFLVLSLTIFIAANWSI